VSTVPVTLQVTTVPKTFAIRRFNLCLVSIWYSSMLYCDRVRQYW
jgi:hypothetical protein